MKIRITTRLNPPVEFDPFQKSGPGSTGPLMRKVLAWLKPAVDTNLFGRPVHYAPFGEPDPSQGRALLHVATAALAVVLILAVYGAWRLVKR